MVSTAAGTLLFSLPGSEGKMQGLSCISLNLGLELGSADGFCVSDVVLDPSRPRFLNTCRDGAGREGGRGGGDGGG